MSPCGFLFKLYRPGDLDIAPQRVANRAILGRRQLDRAERLVRLDAFTSDSKIQRDVLVSAWNRIDPLSHDVDLEGLDRRALLSQYVDDIISDTRRERAEKCFRRALPRLTFAIDAGRRTIRTSRIEAVATHPLDMYARRFRRRLRRRGCCHFSGPFSIGARTAFPHSVQLPS